MTLAPEPNVPPAEPSHERVDVLQGDRLCIRCGYNLTGQHIVREGHYNMLIVRCPECGTVASVQEYPLLGRWAGRWAVVLAAIWFLLLLVLLFVPPIPLVAASYGFAHEALDPLVDRLGDAQQAWAQERDIEIEARSHAWSRRGRTLTHSRYTRLNTEWWEDLDRAVFLRQHGGWTRLVDWWVLRPWLTALILMGAYGMVWSLLLPHVRRCWLPLAGVVILGVCTVYWMFPIGMIGRWRPGDLEDAAMEMIGPQVALALIVLPCLGMFVGLLIGRSAARLAIRALLPPRLRGALSLLWTIDRLDPPRLGRRR